MVPTFYDDIGACRTELWRRLTEATGDRRSAFHAMALGTVDPGGRPQVRSVVLRHVDRRAGSLRFHCDRRSEKASEIAMTGVATLHGYDPEAKIQIRVEGRAVLHTDDWIAEAAWGGCQPMSRVCYGSMPGPGTVLRNGGDVSLPDPDEAVVVGRPNFAAVTVTAERLEFLYLHRLGHRRALWLRSEAGWVETWLAP